MTTRDRFGHIEATVVVPPFTEAHAARARQVADFLRAHGVWDEREFVTIEIDGLTFVVVDIGMRMLTPRELYNAQGFPPDYQIDGYFDKNADRSQWRAVVGAVLERGAGELRWQQRLSACGPCACRRQLQPPGCKGGGGMTPPEQMDREQPRDPEKARLARLAGIADRCLNDSWSIDAYGRQRNIVTRRSTGEQAVICTIHQAALPDEMDLIAGALENLLLFLELRRRAIVALKERQATGSPAARSTAQGGADAGRRLCGERGDVVCRAAVSSFSGERDPTRDIHDKDHADAALKALIGIASKNSSTARRKRRRRFSVSGQISIYGKKGVRHDGDVAGCRAIA